MGKIDTQFRADRSQCSVGSVEQGVGGKVICGFEIFSLKYSPHSLGNIQMWGIFCLMFEFLQFLGIVRIELRRGFPLWTFPYTSISRANADKKP